MKPSIEIESNLTKILYKYIVLPMYFNSPKNLEKPIAFDELKGIIRGIVMFVTTAMSFLLPSLNKFENDSQATLQRTASTETPAIGALAVRSIKHEDGIKSR